MKQTQNWNEKDVKQLIKLRDKGKGWTEIASIMERTPEAVRMFWRHRFGETGGSSQENNFPLDAPRVGVFDVETLPMETYQWNLADPYTSPDHIISGTALLGWAGKFLNDATMYSDILTSEEALAKDEERVTKSCWEFLSKCDVVIGHNMIDFDSKVVGTFFLKHNLPPIKYVMVDTLKIARKHFKFDSNKLQFINRRLGIREKIENEGFPLWRKCREGDPEALSTMREYNEGDIYATEDLFYRLRPYAHSSFNVALYNEIEEPQCPVCGSTELESAGFYYTPAGRWESVRCKKCMCLSRKKENLLGKDKRKSLLVNS